MSDKEISNIRRTYQYFNVLLSFSSSVNLNSLIKVLLSSPIQNLLTHNQLLILFECKGLKTFKKPSCWRFCQPSKKFVLEGCDKKKPSKKFIFEGYNLKNLQKSSPLKVLIWKKPSKKFVLEGCFVKNLQKPSSWRL